MAMRRKTNNGDTAPLRHSIDFSLGGSLGYLVRDANRAFQRLLERRISPHGVTRGQWYFLRVLWEEDGLSQRELSARVGMMEFYLQAPGIVGGRLRYSPDAATIVHARIPTTAVGMASLRALAVAEIDRGE